MVYVSAAASTDEGDQRSGGTRICRTCGTRKPVEQFHWANKRRHRRRRCKECVEIQNGANRAAKPQQYARRSRAAALRRKYGLTLDQFDALLIAQSGRCAICRDPLQPSAIHVDHDHQTGRVRGLLDFTCNTALGKFRDDPELLRAAIDYLAAHAASHLEATA